MRWFPSFSECGFTSIVSETDIASSGKWVIRNPGALWEEIDGAVIDGRLLAIKKSWCHSIALVYCHASDAETVSASLSILREIGVSGELQYKSCRATDQKRDEYLWTSDDFEPTAKITLR